MLLHFGFGSVYSTFTWGGVVVMVGKGWVFVFPLISEYHDHFILGCPIAAVAWMEKRDFRSQE
jgi:hypothetical protein